MGSLRDAKIRKDLLHLHEEARSAAQEAYTAHLKFNLLAEKIKAIAEELDDS